MSPMISTIVTLKTILANKQCLSVKGILEFLKCSVNGQFIKEQCGRFYPCTQDKKRNNSYFKCFAFITFKKKKKKNLESLFNPKRYLFCVQYDPNYNENTMKKCSLSSCSCTVAICRKLPSAVDI